MHKKYLGKYLFCGKLNLWHTLGTAAQHTLVQVSRTDTTSRCSHFYHDPACLTWRTIALRCTVNSLHSWYKLPSTLTTYHTAYLFSFSLPWYVTYSRPKISAKFNYVERELNIQARGYGEFPCAVLWRNLMGQCELRWSLFEITVKYVLSAHTLLPPILYYPPILLWAKVTSEGIFILSNRPPLVWSTTAVTITAEKLGDNFFM